MGITVQKDKGDVHVLQITGMLTKKEFDDIRADTAKKLGFFDRVKLLVIAEKFDGWEPGADWGNSSFFSWHGWKITKIAIVADPQWKSKFLAFTVAGMRRAPVEFFPTGETEKARAWLEENT
ncbi:MAG TPA: STAS/SEC14 domain-containing protein [Verrucomicrobiae bacterium]|nr:STAS/SEC14 domain-containing protein [Verrucomicrobiae bacterium]